MYNAPDSLFLSVWKASGVGSPQVPLPHFLQLFVPVPTAEAIPLSLAEAVPSLPLHLLLYEPFPKADLLFPVLYRSL